MQKIMSLVLVVGVLFGGVVFGDVATAKKPTPPRVETFGSVLTSPIYGQCSEDATTVYVYLSQGYSNTLYTVQASGVTKSFTSSATGSGSTSIAVPTLTAGPESTTLSVTAKSETRSYKVQLDCAGGVVELPVSPLVILQ